MPGTAAAFQMNTAEASSGTGEDFSAVIELMEIGKVEDIRGLHSAARMDRTPLSLTSRQRRFLQMLAKGRCKMINSYSGTQRQDVEGHRAQLMERLQIRM
jgi:FixJ family two-component response regulator